VLAAYARRHACGAIVRSALGLAEDAPGATSLRNQLELDARRAALRASGLRGQISALIRSFDARGVPFALLAGAARIYPDAASALLDPDGDIDLLIPRAALDDALATLHADGYRFQASPRGPRAEREPGRRLAPLVPQDASGASVSLHHQLAPPRALSTPTDWAALSAHLIRVGGPAGPARALDAHGVALHAAIRGLALTRMRDTIVCAQALKTLDSAERQALRKTAAAERCEPVRLQAVLSLAARLAGIPWSEDDDICAYLGWAARREDMPAALGEQAQAIDAWFAAGRRLHRYRPGIIAEQDGGARRTAAGLGRFGWPGWLALAPFAAAYAALMRSR
jgi:hypothetical protein